jgi:hypothetical protein
MKDKKADGSNKDETILGVRMGWKMNRKRRKGW